jgi:hypothetical protein
MDCIDIRVDANCRLDRWVIWGPQIMSVIAIPNLKQVDTVDGGKWVRIRIKCPQHTIPTSLCMVIRQISLQPSSLMEHRTKEGG